MDRRRFKSREEYLNLLRLGRLRRQEQARYEQQLDFEFMTEFCQGKTFLTAKYLAVFSLLFGVILLSTYYTATNWKWVKITDSNYSINKTRRGMMNIDYWIELQGRKIEVTRQTFNNLKESDSALVLITPIFQDVKLIRSHDDERVYSEKPANSIYSFIVSLLFIPIVCIFLPRSGILFAAMNYVGMVLSVLIPFYIFIKLN